MRRFVLPLYIFLLLLCLNACVGNISDKQNEEEQQATTTLIQEPEPLYVFYDTAVKNCIERYFDKSADKLTAEDFYKLSQLHSFSFDVYDTQVTTLRDLPGLFPVLRYVKIAFSWFNEARLSSEDCAILDEMESLRAVDIYTVGLPSLGFVKRLPYVSLRYPEETYLSDKNNLAEASVLGRDFIEKQITGRIKEYVKVADGKRVYELIVTDYEVKADSEFDFWYEAKIFISEKINDDYHFLYSLDIPGRIGNVSGGLMLTDVNFDGQKDILVSQGHFGNQGLVTFACFLGINGTYKPNESFSSIANPSLDIQNQKVLSTWRNWAASHSWAMYSYIKGEFIETDRLTEEPDETGEMKGDGLGVEIEVWKNTTERFKNGNTETKIYLTSDYTDAEWQTMFYDENSFWGLTSDKWRTLYNQGTLLDWSIYGSGADVQIMELIGN